MCLFFRVKDLNNADTRSLTAMRKIFAIVCLIASSIMLGAYFDKMPEAFVSIGSKQMQGLYCKAYVSAGENNFIENIYEYNSSKGEDVRQYGEDTVGVFVLLSNATSTIETGRLYGMKKTKEAIQYKGELYQVFYVYVPDNRHIIDLILSGIFLIAFSVLLNMGKRGKKQKA